MSDAYGQFFEAVEEINFPSSGSTNDLSTVETKSVRTKHDESTFVGKILKTMDKINNNQFESTESLATIGSVNSLTSMSSVQSQQESFPEKVFHTLEALTVNDYGSTNSLPDETNRVSSKQDESTLVGKVLKTMDRINNNQFASTDSLVSMNSSSSVNSMSSPQSEVDFAPKHIFGAVQSLTLNNYASTNSLQSVEESTPKTPASEADSANANVVSQFIEVVGEFMHNHDSQSGPIAASNKSGREPVPIEEIETVFPKFC